MIKNSSKRSPKKVTTADVRAWGASKFGDEYVSARGPLRAKVVNAYNRSHRVKYTPPATRAR